MKDRYNVVSLYAGEPARERTLLAAHFPERPELRTAWTYFDRAHLGNCYSYEREGRTVYDVVEELQERGLYLAERREA